VEDVALGDADFILDDGRCPDLHVLDQALEVRAVIRDLIDDRLPELLALLVGPVAPFDLRTESIPTSLQGSRNYR
jgi:hypothetical protein